MAEQDRRTGVATTVRGVMTVDPIRCQTSAPVEEVARLMRDHDIGDVLVLDGSDVRGIVTDRDLAVRVIAEGRDPATTSVEEICSADPVTVGPDASIDEAAHLMRRHAIRRLPVVEAGAAVGVVSLGDLAVERDPDSALADISDAPPDA